MNWIKELFIKGKTKEQDEYYKKYILPSRNRERREMYEFKRGKCEKTGERHIWRRLGYIVHTLHYQCVDCGMEIGIGPNYTRR